MSGQPPARRIADIMASPVDNLPVTVFPGNEFLERQKQIMSDDIQEVEREKDLVHHQVKDFL